MFDFSAIQVNSQNPGILTILFTVVASLVLGILIAFTYDKTSREIERPNHFLQAIILITIVAATIMQAIGDSLARGLGMLGALSIIRFRTTVRDPRNIVFMFGAIAAGIACGVLGFTIAFVGTLGLCATAFLLRFSSFSQPTFLIGHLQLEIDRNQTDLGSLNTILANHCSSFVLDEYRIYSSEKKAHLLRYIYRLKLRTQEGGGALGDALRDLEEVKIISLTFQQRENENI